MRDAAKPAPPDQAALVGLGSDDWAVVLTAVRITIAQAPHAADATLAEFRDVPTSRLVGGRKRASLAKRLSTDPRLWADVAALITPSDATATSTRGLLDARAAGPADPADRGADGPLPTGADLDREALTVAKSRIRQVRQERDLWRRRAEGAEVRAEGLQHELETARGELSELRAELTATLSTLDGAALERTRAVEREARRQQADVEALREELATLRREEQQRRTAERRRVEARLQAERDARRSASDAQQRAQEERPPRVVPGRPSRLPRGIEPGTTEAARELLHRGRLLLVDGYNVSKQHRGNLELEAQRNWLVQQLGVLVRQRGVRPIVVFDGQERGGSRPSAALREVVVRFTEAGITADDELVLAVEGTDEPVVVVTDDRELTARLAVSGADVIGTRSFLGVVS